MGNKSTCHMTSKRRLIDANELWHKTFSCDEVAEVRKFIEQAPTVDAVEVVHGKWVRRIVDWSAPYSWKVECSNCDFDICGLGDAVLFKYCPNCGAKMDGDGNV